MYSIINNVTEPHPVKFLDMKRELCRDVMDFLEALNLQRLDPETPEFGVMWENVTVQLVPTQSASGGINIMPVYTYTLEYSCTEGAHAVWAREVSGKNSIIKP